MNVPYLLAAIVALLATVVHVYTFERLIWPKLPDDCFPRTPFAEPVIVKALFRRVWHYFTLSWVATSGALFFFTFASIVTYANMLVFILVLYWGAIVLITFVVTAASLQPGQSYIKQMAAQNQWVVILIMMALMVWGLYQ